MICKYLTNPSTSSLFPIETFPVSHADKTINSVFKSSFSISSIYKYSSDSFNPDNNGFSLLKLAWPAKWIICLSSIKSKILFLSASPLRIGVVSKIFDMKIASFSDSIKSSVGFPITK